VAATLQLALSLLTGDPARVSSRAEDTVRDASATPHDYLDPTPRNVSTGAVGVTFVALPTSVALIERVVVDVPPGSDLVLRFGGAVAQLIGTAIAPVFTNETLQLAVDDGSTVTTTFSGSDTTLLAIARRINFAHGQQIADVDVLGRLRLRGLRTGGADAWAKGWSYGRLSVVGGTAVASLGLTTGAVYGQGDDQRVGAGPFCKTFPSGAWPTGLELSGTAQGARFWLAGKQS
jgi:hypothetical protein